MTSSAFNESARQYSELVERSQLAMLDAMDSWTRAARGAATQWGASTPAAPSYDAVDAVDQVYDFAVKMLEMQRGLSKQMVAAALESARQAGRRAAQG